MTVRGILNPSGTACHISSAVVFFCHCLVPLRQAVALSSDDHEEKSPAWLVQFSSFCRVYCDENIKDGSPVDPTDLYEAMKRDIGLNHRILGDALTALAKIIHELRSLDSFNRLLQLTLDGGQAHSRIQGHVNGQIVRFKETRSRPLSCPLSLSTVKHESLQEAFDAKLEAVTIDDYHWNDARTDYENDELQALITTKTLVLDTLPNIWLLHLDRASTHGSDTQSPNLLVTPTLVVKHDGEDLPYELLGGILHVFDLERKDGDDEEGDHSAALVKDENGHWVLIDDDQAVELPDEAAMGLFSGCDYSVVEKGTYAHGMLLVYQSSRFPTEDVAEMLSQLQPDCKGADGDWTQPHALIGRRLLIQWSKGKQYPGHVASYDESTRKHTVQYDDGDVREYILHKKTIRWL